MRPRFALLTILLAALPLGCAASPQSASCGPGTYAVAVSPATATADHAAAAPGNQVQFTLAGAPTIPAGCAVSNVVSLPAWTVSDPVNVQVSSAEASNGLATCVGTTTAPVTVTVVTDQGGWIGKGTATLTCK